MTESRTVLCRELLENTQKAVNRLGVRPEEGLLLLNKSVEIILKIYASYEAEVK